jgi:hypothetical protein
MPMLDPTQLIPSDQTQADFPDEPTHLELQILKLKFEEGKSYATVFVTTFTVYLAINAGLSKYSFEPNVVPTTPLFLSIVGTATSALYVAVSIFKRSIWHNLASDIDGLNKRLGRPLISRRFLILRYMSISTGAFSLFAFMGWIILFARFVRR